MIESDKTSFGSLRFQEICLNFKLFGTDNKGGFYLFNVKQVGEVVVASVKDMVSAFIVWNLWHCHYISR